MTGRTETQASTQGPIKPRGPSPRALKMRCQREVQRRMTKFLEYASNGNLMALQTILAEYQEITGDNQ